MEVEDLEPDIDQLEDASSFKSFTNAEYHYAKMEEYHDMDCFEHESYMRDIYQETQQKSYGLIYGINQAAQGKKNARNVPAKQGLPLEKKHEIQGSRDKVVDT